MWPRIGPVASFGVLYLVGITLHFVLSWRIAKRHKLPRRVWLAVSICYMFAMVVGAKLLYDVRHSQLSISALLQAEHWLGGGLWGGLLAYFAPAVPAVMLLAARRRAGAGPRRPDHPDSLDRRQAGLLPQRMLSWPALFASLGRHRFPAGRHAGPPLSRPAEPDATAKRRWRRSRPDPAHRTRRNTDRGVELPKGA